MGLPRTILASLAVTRYTRYICVRVRWTGARSGAAVRRRWTFCHPSIYSWLPFPIRTTPTGSYVARAAIQSVYVALQSLHPGGIWPNSNLECSRGSESNTNNIDRLKLEDICAFNFTRHYIQIFNGCVYVHFVNSFRTMLSLHHGSLYLPFHSRIVFLKYTVITVQSVDCQLGS